MMSQTSESYRAVNDYKQAALDVKKLDELDKYAPLAVDVSIQKEASVVSIYQKGIQYGLTLHEVFPVLSHFGFRVVSEQFFEETLNRESYHISRYYCVLDEGLAQTCNDGCAIEAAPLLVLQKHATDDRLNVLVSYTCMDLSSINIIRAYRVYASNRF